MQFSHTTTCRFSAQRLFCTYRDHLSDIAPLIRSVRRVSRHSRTDLADGRVDLVHHWHGTPDAVPAFIRPFVQPEMLRWTDTTRWDPHSLTAAWRIELPALGTAVHATGTYRFETHKTDGCVIATGDLSLNAAMLPPAMLPAKAMIEKMIIGLLEPMVADAGDAVVQWLQQQDD
jgi:hypothetical protein